MKLSVSVCSCLNICDSVWVILSDLISLCQTLIASTSQLHRQRRLFRQSSPAG